MKARQDMVILRPREDLERKWASDTIIMPDSALLGADALTVGARRDSAAVCEVVNIGPGSEECPDTSAVKVGDIAVLPLYGASKVLICDGEAFIMTRFRNLAGVVRNLGQPAETVEAVNDYVLTRQDREAFERRLYSGMILPDGHVSDGLPVDSGSDGIVRVVLERVASCGTGHWELDRSGRRVRLQAPEDKPGDLVLFNPIASVRFRRWGTWWRLVPFEDIQAAVE